MTTSELFRRWRTGRQYGYEILSKDQYTRPEGKAGVILAEISMPEDYEFDFYNQHMHHVFEYALPLLVRKLVLADRGSVLLDPEEPLARERFESRQLIDCHGSFTNRARKPYVACEVTWRPPGMKKYPRVLSPTLEPDTRYRERER